MLFIGLIYINEAKYTTAATYLERLVKAHNKSGSGYYYLSVCYAALKKDAVAITNLENALKLKYGEGAGIWSQKEFAELRNTAAFKALMKKYFPDEKF